MFHGFEGPRATANGVFCGECGEIDERKIDETTISGVLLKHVRNR